MSSLETTTAARYVLSTDASGGNMSAVFSTLVAATDQFTNVEQLLDGTALEPVRVGTVTLQDGQDPGWIKAWRTQVLTRKAMSRQDFQLVAYGTSSIPVATWTATDGFPAALEVDVVATQDPATGAQVFVVHSLTLRCASLIRS